MISEIQEYSVSGASAAVHGRSLNIKTATIVTNKGAFEFFALTRASHRPKQQ